MECRIHKFYTLENIGKPQDPWSFQGPFGLETSPSPLALVPGTMQQPGFETLKSDMSTGEMGAK